MEKESTSLKTLKETNGKSFGSWAKPLLVIMVIASLITLTAYLILA